uniref:protein FAM111A-like n=1 Tax=Monopterus albus TaxID=43700 RepID=UPI0009B320BD|nr:protein FAM111A-like [Monopterus albus]
MKYVNVTTVFNYEDDNLHLNWNKFQVKSMLDVSDKLDYMILELHHDAVTENKKVPPGLLKKFGPMPPNGEACIIGHPAGGVKKMDPTCIIEKEKRGQVVDERLRPYGKYPFFIHRFSEQLKDKGIEDIMVGGNEAEQVSTYNTFMYHGSSGSPVFDGQCRVFGLHTAGFPYEFAHKEVYVIECAISLLIIFESFVRKLKEKRNEELLKRVQEEAKGNPYLTDILKAESVDVEPMDVD